METKLKDKLLKLYELAKRGVEGEKINAEKMLNKMLTKHGLTIEDIDQETPKDRYYKYTSLNSKTIVVQVILKVTNRHEIYGIKNYKEVCACVTDYEHVQILEQIDFHLEHFNKERKQFLEDFTNAYVQKHRLYRNIPDKEILKNLSDLSTEEKQAIWRMSNIKECLSNETYTKKLKA